ncbi:MAG: glutamate racemase [Bdellovibrionales bacterium]
MSADLVVMDWGIGGLSVYNEIRRLSPGISILYYSDSGQMPYGKMPAAKLSARVREIILRFADQGVRHFVVACNAASTVLPGLKAEFAERGLEVAGVIEHGVSLIQNSRFQKVGVIGGRRTILSRNFSKPFQTQKRRVVGRIAQPLSGLIESGELHGELMDKTLKEILAPLRDCDAVVLACTHYPAVAPQIQKIRPKCRRLDPAEATARFVKAQWKFSPKSKAPQVFMTSGKSQAMIRSAKLAFNTHISKVIEV